MNDPHGLNPFRIGKAALNRAIERQRARRLEASRAAMMSRTTEVAICVDCPKEFIRRKVKNPKSRKIRCEVCRKQWMLNRARRRAENARERQRKERQEARGRSKIAPCRGCGKWIEWGSTCPKCGDDNSSQRVA